jgi:hypothetical protein
MSVESRPNKLVKGLVLDTFHTDVDNTVATYALNAQLEDQEGNHFHYGSEVGTTYIKEIPEGHVVIGHINMERNETVLFTTDGTNSTIGILSRNDNMAYNYEIKVDDTKQEKKLNFKKQGYVRGVYRLLNGCDKVIYFVDGINKDRRLNINQLDSYKLPDTQSVASGIIFDNNVRATIITISSLTGDIQLIRLVSANTQATSNLLANLNIIKLLQSGISATSNLSADATKVIPIDSSLTANSILNALLTKVIDVNSNLSTQTILSADALVTRLFEASLNGNGSLFANPLITKFAASSLNTASSLNASALVSKLASSSLTGAGTLVADLTVVASGTLLLDLYPNAAAAYSLRKLRTAYAGSAIRVRRSSDNTEQNIGFVAGELDTVSLLAFCGVGNGFITTWYDQSGNAKNATQTTAANQPQIVSSGSVVTQNSKPSIQGDGINYFLTNNLGSTNVPVSTFIASVRTSGTGYTYDWAMGQSGWATALSAMSSGLEVNTQNFFQWSGNTLHLDGTSTLNIFYLKSILNLTSAPRLLFYKNNVSQTISQPSGAISTDGIGAIFADASSSRLQRFAGKISELIIYKSDQNSNVNAINTNINTHYGIY